MILLFLVARRIAAGLTALLARAALVWVAASIVTTAVSALDDPVVKLVAASAILAAYLATAWYTLLSAGERRYILFWGRSPKYSVPEIR
jgi:hypothetical protein